MKIENFKLKIIFIGLFAYLLICLFFPLPSFAQQPLSPLSQNENISVSPSIIKLDLATDQPEADLTYTNNTVSTVELTLTASDFTQLEDGYKLSYLQGKDAQNYHYSLSSWLTFDTTDVTINPHESKTVKVSIEKDKLTTGGHYGTILAEWIQRSNGGNVHVRAILSSLLFVRTAHGNEREEASINLFTPMQRFWFFPDAFTLKFKNSGNVELIPHGLIEIKDVFGNLAAKGIINDGSLITLPETIRRYTILLTPEQSFTLPGFYTATLFVHYGETDKQMHTSMTFFSQGSLPFIPTISVLILVAAFVLRRKWARRVKN